MENLTIELEKLGAEFKDIELIIITHTHADHVGNLAEIKQRSGALVLVHKQGAEKLARGTTSFPEGTNILTKVLAKVAGTFTDNSFPPVEADIKVESEYDLSNFGVSGRVIHTPGYTEDSISVIVEEEYCLAGDTIFDFLFDSLYPPFANDEDKLLDSWQKIGDYNCKKHFPGHGDEFTGEKFKLAVDKRAK